MDDDAFIDSILNGGALCREKPTRAEYAADGKRNRIGLSTDPVMRREPDRRRLHRMNRESAAATQIGTLPRPGEDIVMIMTGAWHGFDLVGAVLDLAAPATIDTLRIATLGFNRLQAQRLAAMIDEGNVGRLVMVVSEHFAATSKTECGELQRLMTERGQTVATTRNHAKLLCFELSDGRKIVAHGSLNLRRCNAFEQVVLSHDDELYEFFVAFIDEMATGAITP